MAGETDNPRQAEKSPILNPDYRLALWRKARTMIAPQKKPPSTARNRAPRSTSLPQTDKPFIVARPPITEHRTAHFEPMLNSKEAAALLRMHHKTLEGWARQGRIPAYHYNGRWHFRASELDGWLRSEVQSSQPIRPCELRRNQ